MAVALLFFLAAAPVQLASPGFTGVNVEPKALAFFSEHFAQHLASPGVRVVSSGELAAVLGLERQKQLLGCSSDSCVMEVSNALGVDGVVIGSVGHFDDIFQVDIKIVSSKDARPLASFSRKASSESKVLELLGQAGATLAGEVQQALGVSVARDAGKAQSPDTASPFPALASSRDAGAQIVACQAKAACAGPADCCHGFGCASSSHVCTAAGPYGHFVEGQLCEFHDQCLDGHCNKNGVCRARPTCGGVRSSCDKKDPCCGNTKGVCAGGFCCLPSPERCAADNSCCSHSCVAGRCEE